MAPAPVAAAPAPAGTDMNIVIIITAAEVPVTPVHPVTMHASTTGTSTFSARVSQVTSASIAPTVHAALPLY